MNCIVTYHRCPTCGAKDTEKYDVEPCRTPKGRKKETVHDNRPFSLKFKTSKEEEEEN